MKPLPHPVSVAAVHLRVRVLYELQYRANFFLQLLQSLLQIGLGLFVVAIIYDNVSELNGWEQPELLAVIGVFTIVGGIMRALVQPPLVHMLEEVQEGSFDFALARPVDSQVLTAVREVDVWQLVDVFVGAAVIAFAARDLPRSPGVLDIVVFLAMLACAAVIAYSMWWTVGCLAFWVVKVPFMHNLFHYVSRSAQYPISIYPAWLRLGLTVLIPLGIAVTAPAEAFTSRLTWGTVVVTAGVTAGTFALCRSVWLRGVRRYSGASA